MNRGGGEASQWRRSHLLSTREWQTWQGGRPDLLLRAYSCGTVSDFTDFAIEPSHPGDKAPCTAIKL